MRILILLSLFVLTACQSATLKPTKPQPPTSATLTQVKAQRIATIRRDVNQHRYYLGAPTFIRIFKAENVLETWLQDPATGRYALFRTYPICKYSGYLGPKLAEGDHQAPEGFYEVGVGQLNPWSKFHLSMNLGFPNEYDEAHGRTGSALMIHGGCSSEGCYAITDKAVEEVYMVAEAAIERGHNVPVHVFPFRMTDENMQRYRNSGWIYFWQNLKEGYDIFEATKVPPRTRHEDFKYVFDAPNNLIALLN